MSVEAERGFPRPSALEWTCLAAGLVLTLQYAWFLDDAFVYYRYVDNLLFLGRGLVFNQGEYVEGYSSPLWALLLIPLRATQTNWWLIVRAVGLLGFAGTWALLVVLNRRLAPRGARSVNLPALLLCFNYAVLTYFTSGVESPLVQLVAVAFAVFVVAPQVRTAQVLVGLAPMIRHEFVLPLAIAVAWIWWSTRSLPWRALFVCAVTLGAWLCFRVVYYADLFPNTFYLKDEVNWGRGLAYLHDTASPYGVYVIAPLLVALALVLRSRGVKLQGAARLVTIGCALAVVVYVTKIGGDPRHYRYLAFPYCLLACASAGLVEHALEQFAPRANAKLVSLGGLCVAGIVFALYPRQLSKHPILRDAQHTKVGEINDAQFHRLKPDIGVSPWIWGDPCEDLSLDALDFVWGDSPLAPGEPSTLFVEYRRWIDSGSKSSDRPVLTEGWCARAYLRFSESLVQYDGLTDPILARTQTTSQRAAHFHDLHKLGAQLAAIRTRFGSSRGTCRRAVEAHEAPAWIANNLTSIELIERKAYNTHSVAENLALAFTRIARIDPGEADDDSTAPRH
jgi:hypothetical protein